MRFGTVLYHVLVDETIECRIWSHNVLEHGSPYLLYIVDQ
jgi:hypothetical protein